MDGFLFNVMIGGESLGSGFKQIFQLTFCGEMSCSKQDVEEMYPYERYADMDMVKEVREEMEKEDYRKRYVVYHSICHLFGNLVLPWAEKNKRECPL